MLQTHKPVTPVWL